MTESTQPGGVLSGISVLSFAQLAQGPAAVQMLADLGASVIKIERPGLGAWERSWAGGNAYINGESLFFLGFNRNQRSLTLDLKAPDGQRIARDLAARADVIVENIRPGVMDRLGLGYDALSERNPGIVYCSGSGFGPDGPYKDRAGQDLILQAESGLASVTGRAGDPPTPTGAPIVDIHAGALLAFGIVSALLGRERSGRGARVESSLLEAALHLQMEPLIYHLNGRFLRDRCEEGTATRFHGAPYGIYETRDGHLALSMNPLPKMAELLDLPALNAFTPEDAFATPAPIKRMIADAMRTRTNNEWIDLF
ncbi:MAG: CaiB/BaiF CoA transferase family protein, partial [Thermomicrobiales bacterium]